jgi:hypothetical protein
MLRAQFWVHVAQQLVELSNVKPPELPNGFLLRTQESVWSTLSDKVVINNGLITLANIEYNTAVDRSKCQTAVIVEVMWKTALI